VENLTNCRLVSVAGPDRDIAENDCGTGEVQDSLRVPVMRICLLPRMMLTLNPIG
jgi:hypothetical protein